MNPNEDDQKLNPGQTDASSKLNSINLNNSENKFAKTDNSSGDDLIDKAAEAENNSSANPYTSQRKEFESKLEEKKQIGRGYRALGKNPLLARMATGKKGPLIGIILTLVGGGIGISTLLSPGLLLVHIKETLFGNLNDAAPALHTRTNRMVMKKYINGTTNAFKYSNSNQQCGIKCKFGTASDTMIENLKKKGFDVKTEPAGFAGTRHVITEMTFPDGGPKVSNATDFAEAMKTPKHAAQYKRVFNSKVVYFMNSKFGQIIFKKFGLDKLTKLAKGGRDKAIASMRKHLGLENIDPNTPKADLIARARDMPKFKKAFQFIDGPLTKFGSKASTVIGYVCNAFNVGRGITYATKVAKIAAFVGFAMLFLNAADQIKAGDADPDVISVLGDQLTATVAGSDKSATDSRGYKMAAYGDNSGGALSDEEKKYSAGPASEALEIVGELFAAAFVGERVTASMHHFCKVINSAYADVAEIAIDVLTGAASLGIGTVVAIVKRIAIAAAVGIAIGIAIEKITEAIVTRIVPNLDETTTGDALGNSLFTGTAQMMGSASASYGLKAGTQDEIRQYAIDTASIRRQEEDIARYEAKDTPFDIYNQYSFLGSMIKNTNMYAISNSSSFMSFFGNIFSIIPRSLATVTSSVGAEAETKAALYGKTQCDDSVLTAIVDADAFCNPSYVMSSEEMDADIDTTVDYMLTNNGGYIDEETGDVIFDGHKEWDAEDGMSWYVYKNDYKNYLDNCAYRTAPLGEQATGIESVYYEWEIGTKCLEDSEMLSHFRTYTMDKSVSDTMNDEEPDDPTGESAGWDEWSQREEIEITNEPELTDPGDIEEQTPEGMELIAKIIKNNNVNWFDRKIAEEDFAGTTVNILKVILGLSDLGYEFSISSLKRSGDPSASQHNTGRAFDTYIVNGFTFDGSDNQIFKDFLTDAAGYAKQYSGHCRIGVNEKTVYYSFMQGKCDDVFSEDHPDHMHIDIKGG